MSRFLLLATLLVALFGVSSATICETYSGTTTNATAQALLIQNIVVRAAVGGSFYAPAGTPNAGTQYNVSGLFNSSGPLYSLFTGATQYRSGAPNYVTDTTQQAALVSKLTTYFGALFGCNAAGYTQPSVTNMYLVHANMGINNAMETYFNTALYNTLLSYGVSTADANTAGTVLSWFNRCGPPLGGNLGSGYNGLNQVCGASDCPIAGNSNQTYCTQVYSVLSSTGSAASTSTGNGASGSYAAGGLFVAAAAIVASLLL